MDMAGQIMSKTNITNWGDYYSIKYSVNANARLIVTYTYTNNKIFLRDIVGNIKWSYELNSSVTKAAISDDGKYILASANNWLYMFDVSDVIGQ